MLKYIITATGIGVGIFAALIILFPSPVSEPLPLSETTQGIDSNGIMVTDGLKHIVPLDKIKGGGPPKDGIPSIDDPQFTTLSGSSFMKHSDIVIGLEINGEAKAYPLSILVWHEIVNDNVGGTPVAVTYCPLCFTNQVFERILNGKEVEFGTSVTIITLESIPWGVSDNGNDSETGEGKRIISAAKIPTPIPVAVIMYFSKSISNYLENIKEFFQIAFVP